MIRLLNMKRVISLINKYTEIFYFLWNRQKGHNLKVFKWYFYRLFLGLKFAKYSHKLKVVD